MKNEKILTNQTIRILARIRNSDGDLVDPQSISFELKKPGDENYTVYTIATEIGITNESTGIYYIDLDLDQPGKWKYSWFTYGNPQSSYKSFFEVENSRYI